MPYSDKDLMVAARIAGYDFNPEVVKANGYNATMKDLLQQDSGVINKLNSTLASAQTHGTPLEVTRAESAIELYNEITSGNSVYGNWIIRDIKNNKDSTGFYGCLIETGSDSAIIGFRGSEGYSNSNFGKDGPFNAFGLLNLNFTQQQADASQFLRDIIGNTGFSYSSFATTGHSLGGNLSEHAAITAPLEMQSKILQAINFDGPGFSSGYLTQNANLISQVADKITHYQWSMMGSLLKEVPGGNFQSIATRDEVNGIYDFASLIQKHDPGFVSFGVDDGIIPRAMDNFAGTVGKLSREIESCQDWMGNVLVSGIKTVMTLPGTEQQAGAISFIGEMLGLGETLPLQTVTGLVTTAAFALSGFANPVFFAETLAPLFKEGLEAMGKAAEGLVDGVVDAGKGVLEAGKEVVKEVGKVTGEIVDGVVEAGKAAGKAIAAVGEAVYNGIKDILLDAYEALKQAGKVITVVFNEIKGVVEGAYQALKEGAKILVGVFSSILDGVKDLIKGLVDWWNENFNEGVKYSKSHPYVRLNTDKLRAYADRLNAINRKLRNLDERLDRFRGKVGFIDEGVLRAADWTIGESGDLNGCIRYLNDTANDFERVEVRIAEKISKL